VAIDPDVLAQIAPTMSMLYRRGRSDRHLQVVLAASAAGTLGTAVDVGASTWGAILAIAAITQVVLVLALTPPARAREALARALVEQPERVASCRTRFPILEIALHGGPTAVFVCHTRDEADAARAELRALPGRRAAGAIDGELGA
jgi:hypothetical protein